MKSNPVKTDLAAGKHAFGTMVFEFFTPGMPQIVKVSAGRQMAGAGWIGLRANDSYRVQAVSDTPLFATLLSLAALLLALGSMWYREGR